MVYPRDIAGKCRRKRRKATDFVTRYFADSVICVCVCVCVCVWLIIRLCYQLLGRLSYSSKATVSPSLYLKMRPDLRIQECGQTLEASSKTGSTVLQVKRKHCFYKQIIMYQCSLFSDCSVLVSLCIHNGKSASRCLYPGLLHLSPSAHNLIYFTINIMIWYGLV